MANIYDLLEKNKKLESESQLITPEEENETSN